MISIIIPIYNVSAVLSTCIQSILVQTYPDFEVLLIDDGSTDESASLCDRYANLDARIRTFHKPNGGVSTARNLGLDNARGEYITCIDSDDSVEADYLEKLIQDFNEDFAVCGFKNTDGITFCPEADIISEDRMTEEVPLMLLDSFLLYTPWGKLFCRDLIERHQLRFDTNLRLYEDTIFVLTYLSLCRTVRKQPFSGYLYMGSWGGTKKYTLSIDEVEYRCQTEIQAIQRLELTFSCHIDKISRAYCVEYIDDLYGKYTDQFCIDIYLKYHTELANKDFIGNLYLYPTYGLISQLKQLYRQKKRVEAQTFMKQLSSFLTVPANELSFCRRDEKYIYLMILFNHLKLADHILYLYSTIKR